MPRLFSALELPRDIAVELVALRVPIEGARWVELDDYHMTLQFVGEITRRQGDEFAALLADTRLPPPEIRIRGTATFGGKNPHALVASVVTTPALEELQRAHEKAAKAAGLAIDKRKFLPHVTIARLDRPDNGDLASYLGATARLDLPPYRPTRAVLMSAKDGGGAPYGVVDSFPFLGHAEDNEAWDD
jgi:RNA 2',3'-cyclic 3'-phosphodiesterase